MFNFLKRFFGTQQQRLLKKYEQIAQQVFMEEQKLSSISDNELRSKTEQFRTRYQKGESLDRLLPEAYAVIKAACLRLCGTQFSLFGHIQDWEMVPYDVQVVAAIALHYGSIAEMQTGEGKTLTASMPLYLNALSGKGVHLVTVNDYLAQRDCDWIGYLFRWLGLKVDALTHQTPHSKRKEVYQADIVYGTAAEFGFDYLRDNSIARTAKDQCQRGFNFAIIDEVDSILIDEARIPLIISGPSSESHEMYSSLQSPVAQLIRIQRDLCNKLAIEAKKILEEIALLDEEKHRKNSKIDEKKAEEAYRKLWLVSKGMPTNKTLKKIKETPFLRMEIDRWDIYYYAESNKEEKQKQLAELYIIVDERNQEYELTDKGILLWIEMGNSPDDFTMIDLGEEYFKIDQIEEKEEEKLRKKVSIREKDSQRKEKIHNLRQLLRAHLLMEKDVHYIVSDGTIIIVDENTGRPQPGRRFSDGLHQAIEAKEMVSVQGETQTYATITIQNYFRLYQKLAGMTGTAITEAAEFKEIYKLDVLVIPTNKPNQRKDFDDEIYMTDREKYNAILKEIISVHATGRPILIGTESVEISEKLSRILKQNKLPHTVLNAKHHAKEAEIIRSAGNSEAITLSTNMAGRGTDIKLSPGIADKGGLHVIGTTRHPARRIDLQLRGRCARQGDPGSSRFYLSLEDELLRLFSSPKMTMLLHRFRTPEGEPIAAKIVNTAIETAQKRIEQRNYQIRKHTLEYDDVLNKQRSEIYAIRNEILNSLNPIVEAEEILKNLCSRIAQSFIVDPNNEEKWNPEGFRQWLMFHFPISFDIQIFEQETSKEIEELVKNKVIDAFRSKIDIEKKVIKSMQQEGSSYFSVDNIFSEIIRNILIHSIDRLWQLHLLEIEHLKTEVHLRAVGQKDPLLEFKQEAFLSFDSFTEELKVEIAHILFKFHSIVPEETLNSRKRNRVDEFRARLSLIESKEEK